MNKSEKDQIERELKQNMRERKRVDVEIEKTDQHLSALHLRNHDLQDRAYELARQLMQLLEEDSKREPEDDFDWFEESRQRYQDQMEKAK